MEIMFRLQRWDSYRIWQDMLFVFDLQAVRSGPNIRKWRDVQGDGLNSPVNIPNKMENIKLLMSFIPKKQPYEAQKRTSGKTKAEEFSCIMIQRIKNWGWPSNHFNKVTLGTTSVNLTKNLTQTLKKRKTKWKWKLVRNAASFFIAVSCVLFVN